MKTFRRGRLATLHNLEQSPTGNKRLSYLFVGGTCLREEVAVLWHLTHAQVIAITEIVLKHSQKNIILKILRYFVLITKKPSNFWVNLFVP